jgi:hypothetical protein
MARLAPGLLEFNRIDMASVTFDRIEPVLLSVLL